MAILPWWLVSLELAGGERIWGRMEEGGVRLPPQMSRRSKQLRMFQNELEDEVGLPYRARLKNQEARMSRTTL